MVNFSIEELIQIIGVTLQMALFSTVISVIIGIPLGLLIGLRKFRGKGIVLRILNTLMGLPPVLAGLVVFFILSASGPLGEFRLLYTVPAMVTAQVVLITPIVCGLSATSISKIAPLVHETAKGIRITRGKEIMYLMYECRAQFISVLFMAFGRSIGEVGAVMLVGGNVQYKTRVMTTAIMLETNKGNFEFAIALGVLLLIISFVINALALSLEERTHKLKKQALDSFAGKVAEQSFNKIKKTFSLVCNNLSMSYDSRIVLDIDSLTLKPGTSYSLLGANGSGKTTLLRILSGVIVNFKGEAKTKDLSIAYLPQKFYIFDFSVLKNIEIALQSYSKEERRARALYALQLVDMLDFAKYKGSSLSGGEAQRVALARVLAAEHDLLLLDEPTSSMDIKGTILAEKAIENYMKATKCLLVMSTHEPAQATRVCDHAIFLYNGRVEEFGPGEKTIKKPNSKELKEFLKY